MSRPNSGINELLPNAHMFVAQFLMRQWLEKNILGSLLRFTLRAIFDGAHDFGSISFSLDVHFGGKHHLDRFLYLVSS